MHGVFHTSSGQIGIGLGVGLRQSEEGDIIQPYALCSLSLPLPLYHLSLSLPCPLLSLPTQGSDLHEALEKPCLSILPLPRLLILSELIQIHLCSSVLALYLPINVTYYIVFYILCGSQEESLLLQELLMGDPNKTLMLAEVPQRDFN